MEAKEYHGTSLSKWMDGTGPEVDVVVSSRVRLARNLDGTPYPHQMSDEEAVNLLTSIEKATMGIFDAAELGDESENSEAQPNNPLVRLDQISSNERNIFVEKHLISPILAERNLGRGVVLNPDETVSIMVNEEDHLRIQCILPGLQLQPAWDQATQMDDKLESLLDIAFDEKLGYLTSCPTNVGTGLRASVMMHLPCLVMSRRINRIINTISQLGLTVRGLYGEGTEAHGSLFQVSNQITLGQTEEEIISKLAGVAQQLIIQERSAREAIYREKGWELEDRLFRAYGILTHARLIDSQEAMSLLSDLRLGVQLGLFPDLNNGVLTELMVLMRPAYLQKFAGRQLNTTDRDILRAELFRKYLVTE